MAITTTSFVIAYNGNGVTQSFSFPYSFLDATTLVIWLQATDGTLTNQRNGIEFTVTGTLVDNVYQNGGTVVMTTAPDTGTVLLIQRRTPRTQLAVYQENDTFPAKSHEHALDKLTLIAQEDANHFMGQSPSTSPPGTYAVGDWFLIYPPIPGGMRAIVCTAVGPPAVWNEFANISL